MLPAVLNKSQFYVWSIKDISCLSVYAVLTPGDEVFKAKAYDIGKRLLPAFNTPTGIPHALVNLATYDALIASCSPTAALRRTTAGRRADARFSPSLARCRWSLRLCRALRATMFLHRRSASPLALAHSQVRKVMDYVVSAPKPPNGLYGNYISAESGQWCSRVSCPMIVLTLQRMYPSARWATASTSIC